jgi:hypothetical protein
VEILLKKGFIKCDLKLSKIEKIEDYSIWLNPGFNILYILDSADQKSHRLSYSGSIENQVIEYYIPGKNGTKHLPRTLLLSYTGAFPIHHANATPFKYPDWKGNLVVTEKTLRASESTVWYPQLYDIRNDLRTDKFTYDITVSCADCKSIYLNGSLPVTGQTAHFTSRVPLPLLLFAGDFNFQEVNGTSFINSDLPPEKQLVLSNRTNEIIQFYEKKLATKYGNKISYLISTDETRRNAWPFFTFPTFAVIGNGKWNINSFFLDKPPLPWTRQTFARLHMK